MSLTNQFQSLLSESFAIMKLSFESSVLLLFILVFWAEAQDESEFLYLDPTENAPVIEFALTDKGDFRKSTKPKVVEFYNPFCVSF